MSAFNRCLGVGQKCDVASNCCPELQCTTLAFNGSVTDAKTCQQYKKMNQTGEACTRNSDCVTQHCAKPSCDD